MVNGAGGCMGPIAVQIAKADGAHVTAVDCAEKLPMLRALGADLVIDYKKEDYLRNGERYDFILDVVQVPLPRRVSTRVDAEGRVHSHRSRALRQHGETASWETYRDFSASCSRRMRDPEKRKSFKFPKKSEAMEIFRESVGDRKADAGDRQDLCA